MYAEALHWILDYVYGQELVHYLDDFLLFNCPDKSLLTSLVSDVSMEEKLSKCADGYPVDFLGIELDTEAMQARKRGGKCYSMNGTESA